MQTIKQNLVIHSAQVDTGDSLRAKFVIGGELTAR